MIDAIETFSDIRVKDQFGSPVMKDGENGFHGVMATATRSETIRVRLKDRLPFWFQCQFGQHLLGAVVHNWDTQRSLLSLTWLGKPNPTNREGHPIEADALSETKFACGSASNQPVEASGTFAFV
jgi:hypothetical protein